MSLNTANDLVSVLNHYIYITHTHTFDQFKNIEFYKLTLSDCNSQENIYFVQEVSA